MLQDINEGEEIANKVHEQTKQMKSIVHDQSLITIPIEREKKINDENATFATLVSWLNLEEGIIITSVRREAVY